MRYDPKKTAELLPSLTKEVLCDPGTVIRLAEERYSKEVDEVCGELLAQNKSVLLLCGPTSAGKTTTSARLLAGFAALGKKAEVISLDDFYRPQPQLPLWPDGEIDYESIEGLDLDAYGDIVSRLISTGHALMGAHDFLNDSKGAPRELSYDGDTVLIIEGLHALNPVVAAPFPKDRVYRLYISPHSDFTDGEGRVLITARQLRLTRRMVRDYHSRGASAAITMKMWRYILKGEEEYIHPFRELADRHINTTHAYEPFLYAPALERIAKQPCPPNMRTGILKNESDLDTFKPALEELFGVYRELPPLSPSLLPESSLIHEVIF